jgi:hypothetical protein
LEKHLPKEVKILIIPCVICRQPVGGHSNEAKLLRLM